ncbi:hypothetical protein ACRRTK_022014 [Alexandromys fortis]
MRGNLSVLYLLPLSSLLVLDRMVHQPYGNGRVNPPYPMCTDCLLFLNTAFAGLREERAIKSVIKIRLSAVAARLPEAGGCSTSLSHLSQRPLCVPGECAEGGAAGPVPSLRGKRRQAGGVLAGERFALPTTPIPLAVGGGPLIRSQGSGSPAPLRFASRLTPHAYPATWGPSAKLAWPPTRRLREDGGGGGRREEGGAERKGSSLPPPRPPGASRSTTPLWAFVPDVTASPGTSQGCSYPSP